MIDRVVAHSLSVVMLVVALGFALKSCGAFAQPPPIVDPSDELVIDALRVRISEADFRPECDSNGRPRGCVTDGAAIIERHLHAAKRRGTSLHRELRAYSRRATGQERPRSPRGAWVAALTNEHVDGIGVPPGWPPRISWTGRSAIARELRRSMAWLLTAALNGEPHRVCRKPPDHWGGVLGCDGTTRGACDRVPHCWERVDCGPTVNAFYVVECPRIRTLPASAARGRR